MERKYSQTFIDSIEEGLIDIAEGRVHTQEEVLKKFAGKTDKSLEPDFDNLTPEEQEMEDSFESGEYEPKPITDEQKKSCRQLRVTLLRRHALLM